MLRAVGVPYICRLYAVKSLIGKLGVPARETLQCLMRFLVKVTGHSDNNKMKSQYVGRLWPVADMPEQRAIRATPVPAVTWGSSSGPPCSAPLRPSAIWAVNWQTGA